MTRQETPRLLETENSADAIACECTLTMESRDENSNGVYARIAGVSLLVIIMSSRSVN